MKFLIKDFAIIVILNKQGDRSRLATLYLIHQPTSLASISVSPWVGSHKLFELLHISDAFDILFLLEPLLDSRSIEIQSIASEIFRLFCVILCRFL